MHFFTAFPDNWLSGTAELTAEETGAFWNLCCYYMLKDGKVPDDDRLLARIAKLEIRAWRRVKARLLEGVFIEVRDGYLWQAKCEDRLNIDGKFAQSQRDKINKRWANKTPKPLKTNGSGNTGEDTAVDTIPSSNTNKKSSSTETASRERLGAPLRAPAAPDPEPIKASKPPEPERVIGKPLRSGPFEGEPPARQPTDDEKRAAMARHNAKPLPPTPAQQAQPALFRNHGAEEGFAILEAYGRNEPGAIAEIDALLRESPQ